MSNIEKSHAGVHQTSTAPAEAFDDGGFIPGTVRLVDTSGNVAAKHSSSHRDIVLVPTPSSDPDDPLNWAPRRKMLAASCFVVYTVVIGIASAAIYSVFVPIQQTTGLSLGDMNAGTGYMFLFFGWSCLVSQPLALQYGKRPIYLVSLLGTMATQIWAPYTKTNGQWIANKVLQGFFGSPVESLVEITITDVFFTHERGKYIALYALSLAGSSFFAPVIAGFIADGQSWEWVLFWCAIFCAIAFVHLFFFMEETNYHRVAQTTPAITSGFGGRKDVSTAVEEGRGHSSTSNKTFVSKMKLFQPSAFSNKNQLLGMVRRPLIFLSFPIIFYSGALYGSNLINFNIANSTAALVLFGPPYNFKAEFVGVAYLGPLIGVVIGFLYTGFVGDWLLIKLARRNGGIMEAEHRLWLLVASVICIPLGLILWGVGAAHGIHWFGLVFALGVIAFTNTVGLQTAVAYCIDSYRGLSGEAIVTVILVRNTMSFAINYAITPWITGMGLQNSMILAGAIGMAFCLTFLIFIKYGKAMRRSSTQRYLRYVKELDKAGLGHN